MNEDFLHYVWKFQKFTSTQLQTEHGEPLQILEVGQHNVDAGPDFFFGKVAIAGQVWVGTIEIHLQSSHWYSHQHERDPRYDSVVLHVVWEHDMDIKRSDESIIPTLELKGLVSGQIITKYQKLFSKEHRWIQCEAEFAEVDSFVVENWLDRLFFERLEDKSEDILKQLSERKKNWEAVLFHRLCKSFGLKVNATSFESISASIPHRVLLKVKRDGKDLEALLLGQAGLLKADYLDPYHQELKEKHLFLCAKFGISNLGVATPKFFRLRPPNFPSIRLAQLAALLHRRPNLFSELLEASSLLEYYELFDLSASSYWDTHYNFGVVSKNRKKRLSKPFIDLLLLNTVLPLKYCHGVSHGKDMSEETLQLVQALPMETNRVVQDFLKLRSFEGNAAVSQSLLQLKQHYCDRYRCLHCAIGNAFLKQT